MVKVEEEGLWELRDVPVPIPGRPLVEDPWGAPNRVSAPDNGE